MSVTSIVLTLQKDSENEQRYHSADEFFTQMYLKYSICKLRIFYADAHDLWFQAKRRRLGVQKTPAYIHYFIVK